MDTKYTIAEAAKITKVSQRTLLRAIKNGNLKTEKAGRRHLISERTLNSYLGGSNISLNDALLTFLKNKGATNIRFVCLVASPAGVTIVQKHHPEVPIYTAAIDRGLNNRGYIMPGLGDAGDRVFGTE